jgi:hypothetical protein
MGSNLLFWTEMGHMDHMTWQNGEKKIVLNMGLELSICIEK